MRAILAIACLSLIRATSLAQDTAPAFEVASIKPAAPQDRGRHAVHMASNAGRVDYANVSLDDVLTRAYGVKRYQILGPGWLFADRFDIAAKVPEGISPERIPAMLQRLLQERFRMTVHLESRQEKVYAFVVGRSGPKLKRAEDADTHGSRAKSQAAGAGKDEEGKRGMMIAGPNGDARLVMNGVTLEELADSLSKLLDRPVTNQTGIEGAYDFALDISGDGMAHTKGAEGSPNRSDSTLASDSLGSIFAAVQQYGLRLELRKAPVKYIVVDKAERIPIQN